jgi:predicted nucleotidyltransferase
MKREQILAMRRERESKLRASGVEKLSIFGSAARGDTTEDSDVDGCPRQQGGLT